MATTEIRQGHRLGSDGAQRAVQQMEEPPISVSFVDTTSPVTVELDRQTTLVRIISTALIKYEVAPIGTANAESGSKRGEIPAAAMPFLLPIKPVLRGDPQLEIQVRE